MFYTCIALKYYVSFGLLLNFFVLYVIVRICIFRVFIP